MELKKKTFCMLRSSFLTEHHCNSCVNSTFFCIYHVKTWSFHCYIHFLPSWWFYNSITFIGYNFWVPCRYEWCIVQPFTQWSVKYEKKERRENKQNSLKTGCPQAECILLNLVVTFFWNYGFYSILQNNLSAKSSQAKYWLFSADMGVWSSNCLILNSYLVLVPEVRNRH